MKKSIALWKWILLFLLAVILGFIGLVLLKGLRFHPVLIMLCPVVLLALYAGGVRLLEGEPAKDLAFRRMVPDVAGGWLVGALLMSAAVGIIAACGCMRFVPGDFTWIRQMGAFCACMNTAVGEEMLFRGVLYRWIDERWGVVPALIVSSLLFGLIHLGNANATVWSSVAIAIEAGLLLGAAYKWSGTLWFPIGIHWTWNFVQGKVFGISVSGGGVNHSFWKAETSGPEIITGGAFGVEASIVMVILGVALSAIFLYLHYRKKQNIESYESSTN